MAPPNDELPSALLDPGPISGSGPIDVRATVWRRPSRLVVLLGSFAVGAVGAGAAAFAAGHKGFALLPYLVLGTFGAILTILGTRKFPKRKTCDVHAGHAGLAIDGEHVARDRIASAMASYDRRGCTVHIELRGAAGDVTLGVSSVEWARAIVGALGFDGRRTTATFWGSSRVNEGLRGIALIVALPIVLGVVFHSILLVFALALVSFLLAMLVPTKIVVGMDGVLVRWLVDRRYFPLKNIAWVERMPARVRLHLEDGKSFDVFFRANETTSVPEAGMLAERIVAAIERRGTEGASLDPSLLARPVGVDARAWIEALGEVLRDGTFRDAPVTAEQLWGVVENGKMDAARRAAAAVALRKSLDDRGRRRLRVAARSIAEPHLRVALERAADGDDAAIAEAVEALGDGEDDGDRAAG